MNDTMEIRPSLFAAIWLIALVFGVMYSATSSRADGPQVPETVAVSPFEYYPAQFASPAAEQAEHIPTF